MYDLLLNADSSLCLYVVYKGCNQWCHNVSVPVGEVSHCLSGEDQHTHTHTHAHSHNKIGQVVFLPLSQLEKDTILESEQRCQSS